MLKSDLSKAKVGDYLITLQSGRIKIVNIDELSEYPIKCETVNDEDHSYTLDGRYYIIDSYPSAFLPEEFPTQNGFKDYWAMVSNKPISEKNIGVKRKVIMHKYGKFITWEKSTNAEMALYETSTASWDYVEPIIENEIPEYTMEELTKMLGKEFKIKINK